MDPDRGRADRSPLQEREIDGFRARNRRPDPGRRASGPQRLLIGAERLDAQSGETFLTYNPATGEPLAEVARAAKADIDLAVQAARQAFESSGWRKMTAMERSRLLYRLADLIERDAHELAVLECLDNGKPATLTRAVEVEGSIKTFRYFAGWPTKFGGETLPVCRAAVLKSSTTRPASRLASQG